MKSLKKLILLTTLITSFGYTQIHAQNNTIDSTKTETKTNNQNYFLIQDELINKNIQRGRISVRIKKITL
ncbi:MAG: hypothetical protein WC758_01260 [Candidatus Woesearchaeota archaeon]|jgi:hypothetical protein